MEEDTVRTTEIRFVIWERFLDLKYGINPYDKPAYIDSEIVPTEEEQIRCSQRFDYFKGRAYRMLLLAIPRKYHADLSRIEIHFYLNREKGELLDDN